MNVTLGVHRATTTEDVLLREVEAAVSAVLEAAAAGGVAAFDAVAAAVPTAVAAVLTAAAWVFAAADRSDELLFARQIENIINNRF